MTLGSYQRTFDIIYLFHCGVM